jgi:hypothetical protein
MALPIPIPFPLPFQVGSYRVGVLVCPGSDTHHAVVNALPSCPEVPLDTTHSWDALILPITADGWVRHAPATMRRPPAARLVVLCPTRPNGLPLYAQWLAAPVRFETLLQSCQQALAQTALPIGRGVWLQQSPPSLRSEQGTIELTAREAALLLALSRTPHGIARDTIQAEWWGASHEAVESHAMETQLYRIRQKLLPVVGTQWSLELRDDRCRLFTET